MYNNTKHQIHPTAVIENRTELGENVVIGPYTVITGHVKIGSDTVIQERVSITGNTIIGMKNIIHPGAVIGSSPQDTNHMTKQGSLVIGDNNVIREYVTINTSTDQQGKTSIGNNNYLMAYSHVAHDCTVGNHVVLSNSVNLGGYVMVDDYTVFGGDSGAHQHVRIGKLVMVGGCSKLVQDIPPFMIVDGYPAKIRGINMVGLNRIGLSGQDKAAIKKAYKVIYRSGLSFKSAVEKLEQDRPLHNLVEYLICFIKETDRGICKGI